MARLKFVQKVWSDMLLNGGIEKEILTSLKVVHVKKDHVIAQMPIEKKHTNRLGSIHGGVLSTLVDVGGSLAMASRGYFMTGVTTDLSTTYLSSGGKPGDNLEIHCFCQKLGKSMAFTFVEIHRDGRMVARGNHSKYIAHATSHPENTSFDQKPN